MASFLGQKASLAFGIPGERGFPWPRFWALLYLRKMLGDLGVLCAFPVLLVPPRTTLVSPEPWSEGVRINKTLQEVALQLELMQKGWMGRESASKDGSDSGKGWKMGAGSTWMELVGS